VLKKRRGNVVADHVTGAADLHTLEARLPVAASFGFAGDLLGATSGKAFPSCVFSHWQVSLVEGLRF
jgi:elongation factor 2